MDFAEDVRFAEAFFFPADSLRDHALRKRLNLYQKDFAEQIGITPRYVIYLEQGVKEPGETLKGLLDCLEKKERMIGMATGIYRRGNVWWIRYTGIDGKQKREPAGKKFQDASLLLAHRKNAAGQNKGPELDSISNHLFPELTEKYIDWITERHTSAKVKGYIIGQ